MIELSDLLTASGGQVHGPTYARRFSAFSYDSRLLPASPSAGHARKTTSLAPLFVAVKTGKGDGHDYIAEAVARGAAGALCQRPVDLSEQRATCIVVPDTQAALMAYARHVLQRANLTTIAITGSTGKTTAKELIAAVLAGGDRPVFRNRGSINGRYGLSIAAGELEPHHELAVLELAADSFDEIRELADMTRPDVGVLTAINEAHLATFGSLAAIADEKGRLLEALPANGLAVLNADDSHVMALAPRTRAQIITVSTAKQADLRAVDIVARPDGIAFTVHLAPLAHRHPQHFPDTAIRINSPLLGRHQIPLLLSAVAVGLWLGRSGEEIAAALARFGPLPGHLCPLAGRRGCLILDDTVNASPAANLAALDVLAGFDDRPHIAVLGDMWELGDQEAAAHRRVGQRAAQVVDWLLVKGVRAQQIASGALDAGLDSTRIFRAYTDADVLRFLDKLLDSRDESATRLSAARFSNGDDDASRMRRSGQRPVILVKGDRQARMERIVARLLADPARAEELLVRQSPGWQAVRPLMQDRPTWVEIDLEAVANNVRQAQEIVGPDVAICAVLKADGYGHGAVGVARTALNNGVRMLAVACLAEAITLRRAAIDAPILVLGYTPAWQARDTLRHDVIATIYDLDVARALSRAAADLNRPARVHVKVDTGMGRLGLLPGQVLPFARELARLPGLVVEGIFTHLSVADSRDPAHITHTRRQLAAFNAVLADLEAARLLCAPGRESAGRRGPGDTPPLLIHAANSAGMLAWPESHFNMVRLGIALYGLAPSAEVPLPAGFRPALSWKTQVAQVKRLPPGSPISYGNTYRTNRETTIAVVPVGYADGFRRAPRHWEYVLVHGQRAPIVGRVCMDQTMLDVTGIPGVRQGDEVVLIGRQGDAEITVDQVAERLGTINYEVVSEILARVSRVV